MDRNVGMKAKSWIVCHVFNWNNGTAVQGYYNGRHMYDSNELGTSSASSECLVLALVKC